MYNTRILTAEEFGNFEEKMKHQKLEWEKRTGYETEDEGE